jgi:hypothetical protein
VVSPDPVSPVGALVDALTENRCTVHGPMHADEGAVRVVELALERAAGAPIALPLRDPAVVWLELESRLAFRPQGWV